MIFQMVDCLLHPLRQQPPIFLAPGIGFVEDSFPLTEVRGMVSGWFRHLMYIVPFVITVSVPPQIVRD